MFYWFWILFKIYNSESEFIVDDVVLSRNCVEKVLQTF